MNKVKVVGYKNEGFFMIPLGLSKEGKEIVLYRPERIIKKEV